MIISPAIYFNDFKLWLPVMGRFLEKKIWSKNYKKIYVLLKTVNLGLKPSFLWDIGPQLSSQLVNNFISVLKQELLMATSVSVMTVGSEIFVVNMESLDNILSDENFFKFIRMDSEISFDIPNENRSLLPLLKAKINEHFTESHEEVPSLDFPDYLLTQIFGIMLGYPVVYSSEENETQTCYNFVSLINVKVSISLEGRLQEIYSFTHLPNDILSEHVQNWFRVLKTSYSGCSVSVSRSNITVPSVVL